MPAVTTLQSVFRRAALALALIGTGIVGAHVLPQPRMTADAAAGCGDAQAKRVAEVAATDTPTRRTLRLAL